MSREKQIEEMGAYICTLFHSETMSQALASLLYDKGYRKATDVEKELADWKAIAEQYQKQFEDCYEEKAKIAPEVAREIFEEIQAKFKDIYNEGKVSLFQSLVRAVNETEKKYTEEGK